MQRLIIIAVTGNRRALDRLGEFIDQAVEQATQEGGIVALTTEIVSGRAADRALEQLRSPAPPASTKEAPR